MRASVLLPTWNGEADLRRLMPRLVAQELAGGFEILAIDSSSSDRSVEVLRQYGAAVESIAKSEFRHGGARNRCAARAQGEFLVFLSQDTEPVDVGFLEALLAPFEDVRVAGVTARVVPFPDNDALTARTVLEAPEAGRAPIARDLDGLRGLQDLSSAERVNAIRFNNVASAIRASVFRTLPFPDIAFGEDVAWAARALTAGWRVRFVPEAVVRHAHAYRPAQAFERYRVDAAFHRLLHGHLVRPSLASLVRGFLYEVRQDVRYVRRTKPADGWRALARSPLLRSAQVLGQYVGSHGWRGGPRGEATGRMR